MFVNYEQLELKGNPPVKKTWTAPQTEATVVNAVKSESENEDVVSQEEIKC